LPGGRYLHLQLARTPAAGNPRSTGTSSSFRGAHRSRLSFNSLCRVLSLNFPLRYWFAIGNPGGWVPLSSHRWCPRTYDRASFDSGRVGHPPSSLAAAVIAPIVEPCRAMHGAESSTGHIPAGTPRRRVCRADRRPVRHGASYRPTRDHHSHPAHA